MILYVDDNGRIKDVGYTEDANLHEVYVNENDPDFPFNDKSTDFICSFKVTVNDNGVITMSTPYVSSKALPHIDEQGQKNDDKNQALAILLGEVEE